MKMQTLGFVAATLLVSGSAALATPTAPVKILKASNSVGDAEGWPGQIKFKAPSRAASDAIVTRLHRTAVRQGGSIEAKFSRWTGNTTVTLYNIKYDSELSALLTEVH